MTSKDLILIKKGDMNSRHVMPLVSLFWGMAWLSVARRLAAIVGRILCASLEAASCFNPRSVYCRRLNNDFNTPDIAIILYIYTSSIPKVMLVVMEACMGMSNNQASQHRPKIVGLFFTDTHKKGLPINRNSHILRDISPEPWWLLSRTIRGAEFPRGICS